MKKKGQIINPRTLTFALGSFFILYVLTNDIRPSLIAGIIGGVIGLFT